MLKVKSAFVGVAMAANAFITMPISAFADEETSHTYKYDGYEVSYDVTNAWGNTEVVSVTLSNTGDSTIENWMLFGIFIMQPKFLLERIFNQLVIMLLYLLRYKT